MWAAEIAALGHETGDILTAVQRAAGVPVVAPRLTTGQVIDALSTSGSSWSRAQVMRAVTDLARPVPSISGIDWARTLERACDQVMATYTNLDPAAASHPRRCSDGRSVWIEPVAAHLTSTQILDEEEHIMSWAIDAQLAESAPSATVAADGLDVLHGDVARALAGHDRLVLAVGPAGKFGPLERGEERDGELPHARQGPRDQRQAPIAQTAQGWEPRQDEFDRINRKANKVLEE